MHPGDLAGEFSDLEMTWLLYCACAATALPRIPLKIQFLFLFMSAPCSFPWGK